MELGFSVKAGPLSQIGLQIVNLDTAVQLAVGAYGWWKANARCQTLCQLFEVAGGQLVASSAFDLEHYRGVRDNHHVWGAVVQNNEVHSVLLPKASTAVSSDPGLTCLRALISALLCFYTIDSTVFILSEVIPYNLIELDQSDTAFEIKGPLLSSLKSSVESIAAEEDNNSFRKYLLEQAIDNETMLFQRAGPTKIRQTSDSDVALSIGMLKWALTPLHRRALRLYATSSVTVWMLATVLKRVGFDVSASQILIKSIDDSQRYSAKTCQEEEVLGDVMLNVEDYGPADLYSIHVPPTGQGGDFSTKPQVMAIKSIPLVAYRHARQNQTGGTEYLADIFNYVFEEVQRTPGSISMVNENVTLQLHTVPIPQNHFHDAIAAIWSPHIGRIASRFISQYAPSKPIDEHWNIDDLRQAFDEYRAKKTDFDITIHGHSGLRIVFQTVQAIMLAISYGMISHFLLRSSHQSPQLVNVVFSPLILKDGRLLGIINELGRLLIGTISYSELWSVLAELVVGWPSSAFDSIRTDERFIFGVQRNGLAVISQFALRPSIDMNTLCRFQIAEGHILNLPLTEDGCIALYGKDKPSRPISPSAFTRPENRAQTLMAFDKDHEKRMYHLSLEPYWEESPRAAVFRLRREGTEFFPVSPDMFRNRLLGRMKVIRCSCGSPAERVEVTSNAEDWRPVYMRDIFPYNTDKESFANPAKTNPMRSWRQEVGERHRALIDARRCLPLQVMALGVIRCKHLFVSIDCLRCTYDAVARLNPQAGGVVIMLTE